MLPKPEKKPRSTSKKNPDQIDLVKTLSSVNQIEKKRKFLIILLGLTVGLSFIFWLYRSISATVKSGDYHRLKPQLSLPRLNLPTQKASSLSTRFDSQKVQKYLTNFDQSDSATWSIYLNSDPNLSFSYNQPNLPQSPPTTSNTDLVNNLPQGLPVVQNLTTTDDSLFFQIIISPPHKQISIAITASDSANIDSSKNLIPSLVDYLYWQVIQVD